jgi:ankyrin repeat protein
MASQNNFPEVVRLLLDHGADVNISPFNGVTPLTIASQEGHIEIVTMLSEKGIDLDSNDVCDFFVLEENCFKKSSIRFFYLTRA